VRDSSVSSARLIKETGAKIADAMSLGVSGDAFIQALESDEVTLSVLDNLSCFCHCQLTTSDKEASMLINLMREGWPAISDSSEDVESAEEEVSSKARSQSLALLIKLSGICAESKKMFDVYHFRGMTYSQSDMDKQPITYSESLSQIVGHWQVYQRNEVLAVAMQGLFFVLLRAVDLNAESINKRFMSTRELCGWFWKEGLGNKAFNIDGAVSLSDALTARSDQLPAFGDWRNEAHECQLIEAIVKQTEQASLSEAALVRITSMSLDVLAAVCCRAENQGAYGEVQFRAGYLDPYPVNLNSVAKAINDTLSQLPLVDALVKFTTHYCLDSHLRVAMRKLRQQGQNTSRFEMTENGLVIKVIPPATHTSPRFYQAMRILRDLGLMVPDEALLRPSETGLVFLESVS